MVKTRNQLDLQIDLHRKFWEKKSQKQPIVSYRHGDFFFSRHFKATESLNIDGKIITPEMLVVEDFLPDYERMYQESLILGQSAFWTAEPFTGIPWMEAILGCTVVGQENSFISSHPESFKAEDIENIVLKDDNAWLNKFLEFTEKLVALSDGRFPVGQPIMRGPTDMIGALIGQTEMIYWIYESPELFPEIVKRVTNVFLDVIQRQKALIPAFEGGSSIGFYHLWTPDSCIWFQDDLSSILSPELYARYFIEAGRRICSAYDRSAVHLHPSSFFVVDDLLRIEELDVIEVNKDIGGPEVEVMLPVLKNIMDRKRLILWGDLTIKDLELLRKELPLDGLFLNVVTEDLSRIHDIQNSLSEW